MREKISDYLWGILFIVVGIGVFGNAFNFWSFTMFFKGWWTLFIIVPCIISLIRDGVRIHNILGIVIGFILLLECRNMFPRGVIGKLIFPVILILIGVKILLQEKFQMKVQNIPINKLGILRITSILGSNGLKCANEDVKGADIFTVFGGVDLDLRESIISEDITIKVAAIFGGVDIYVSNNVNVKVRSIPIFGGVDNKAPTCTSVNAPTIYVDAICIFGGMDIQ